MRHKPVKFLLIAAGLLVFFVLGYSTLVSFLVKPKTAEKALIENVESITGGHLVPGEFRFSSFPLLLAELKNPELTMAGELPFSLKARRAKFYFSFLDSLLGRIRISRIQLEEGELVSSFKIDDDVRINQIELTASRQGSKKLRVRFSAKSPLVSSPLSGQFEFGLSEPSRWNKKTGVLKGVADFRGIQIPQLGKFLGMKNLPLELRKGAADGKVSFSKAPEETGLRFTGQLQVSALSWETYKDERSMVSPEVSPKIDFDAVWDLAAHTLDLQRVSIHSSGARLEGSGRWEMRENYFKNFRMTIFDIQLDALPQYYLPLKEAIPFNLGFSGKSNLEMTFDGQPANLAMHANWDLTQSLLTYGGQFAKPKDTPLSIVFDFGLSEGRMLSGDFSLQLFEAAMKGTVSSLDLGSGEGQINILTNKFDLKGWEKMFPPVQDGSLGGQVKLLANFSGNLLRSPNQVKPAINVSIENGFLLGAGGKGIKNVFMTLDYGLLSFELKKFEFSVDDSPACSVNLSATNLLHDPAMDLTLESEELDAPVLLENIQSISSPWLSKKQSAKIGRFIGFLRGMIPPGEKLKKFNQSLRGRMLGGIEIKKMNFDASGGKWDLTGEWNGEGGYALTVSAIGFDLERFLSQAPFVAGHADLKMELRGYNFDPSHWQESLTGSGSILVRNGELRTIHLAKAISLIPSFSAMDGEDEGTAFKKLKAQYEISNGKIMVRSLGIESQDSRVQGSGEISLNGLLNFRLDVFFPFEKVGASVAPWLAPPQASDEIFWFGAAPLLLSGELKNPELKPDSSALAEFEEKLSRRQSEGLLRRFSN